MRGVRVALYRRRHGLLAIYAGTHREPAQPHVTISQTVLGPVEEMRTHG